MQLGMGDGNRVCGYCSHVVRQLLEVLLLLGEAGLELDKLLLLALPDGVVLAGALALLEGVSVFRIG